MKKLFLIFSIALTVAACSKSSDPAPSPSASVQGNYVLSRIKVDAPGTANDSDYTLPLVVGSNKLTGIMKVSPGSTDSKVKLLAVLSSTGQADQNSDFGEVSLTKNGSSYDMLEGTSKVGTIDGTNLNISFTDSGTSYLLIARK